MAVIPHWTYCNDSLCGFHILLVFMPTNHDIIFTSQLSYFILESFDCRSVTFPQVIWGLSQTTSCITGLIIPVIALSWVSICLVIKLLN